LDSKGIARVAGHDKAIKAFIALSQRQRQERWNGKMAGFFKDKTLECSLLEGIFCTSLEETHSLAKAFAMALPENSIVHFHGDLGMGKTSFVHGMAKAYAISTPITSPTFNLWALYRGTLNLFHIDAYRLRSQEEMDGLYLEDFLELPYVVCVEWPEKIPMGYLRPSSHLWFSQGRANNPDERIIRLSWECSAVL
jgi:tRNA threonylcarbamoyladenosine biosynthesis protein TsaE